MIKLFTLSFFRKVQHAMEIETRTEPATLATMMLIESVNGDPSNKLITKEGTIIKAKPVAPSNNEVTINNRFIGFNRLQI